MAGKKAQTPPSTIKWQEGPMLAYDVESGGVNVWSDRIVTIALVDIRPGRRPQTTSWLLNPGPGYEIPAEATAVHGITTAYAREHGVDPATALFEATGRLAVAMNNKIPTVGFNLSFDLSILEAENRRNSIPTLAERLGGVHRIGPCVDTYVLDKYADAYRKGGRKLSQVCQHYGVILGDAHTADADALAAARLWPRILAKHEKKLDMPLPMLHQQQVVWRRQQMDSLREYFDRKQIEHDGCDGGWPLQNRPADDVAIPGVAS